MDVLNKQRTLRAHVCNTCCWHLAVQTFLRLMSHRGDLQPLLSNCSSDTWSRFNCLSHFAPLLPYCIMCFHVVFRAFCTHSCAKHPVPIASLSYRCACAHECV